MRAHVELLGGGSSSKARGSIGGRDNKPLGFTSKITSGLEFCVIFEGDNGGFCSGLISLAELADATLGRVPVLNINKSFIYCRERIVLECRVKKVSFFNEYG